MTRSRRTLLIYAAAPILVLVISILWPSADLVAPNIDATSVEFLAAKPEAPAQTLALSDSVERSDEWQQTEAMAISDSTLGVSNIVSPVESDGQGTTGERAVEFAESLVGSDRLDNAEQKLQIELGEFIDPDAVGEVYASSGIVDLGEPGDPESPYELSRHATAPKQIGV